MKKAFATSLLALMIVGMLGTAASAAESNLKECIFYQWFRYRPITECL